MTTYYISPSGSDSNNGLGPDASHASNKPFLTLGKVLVSGSPLNAGDVVYVAPGYYYSAGNHTVLGSISSVASPTQIIGDPSNAQGFKDGSGVLLSPGLPWITTRTSAEGIAADPEVGIASTNNMMQMTTNTVKGLQFKNLCFETKALSSSAVVSADVDTESILFQDCRIYCSYLFSFSNAAYTAALNNTVRRCVIFTTAGSVFGLIGTTASSDVDLNLLAEDNLVIGKLFNVNTSAGSGAGTSAGGMYFYGNTLFSSGSHSTVAAKFSTTYPIKLKGNLIIGSAAFSSGDVPPSGTIIDDGYNRWCHAGSSSGLSNITVASTSAQWSMLNLVLPDLVRWGLEMPRPDFLGWTDAASTLTKFAGSSLTSTDFFGRTARPWGAGASIGYVQAKSISKDTSSSITGGGTNSLKITGAGEVSFYIPVDAVATTISVRTKSTSYGGTNYPQLIVVANPSIGVTSDTTVTASSATEATITTASFTPTSQGVMEVRLISRSSSTTSTTHFDLLTSG